MSEKYKCRICGSLNTENFGVLPEQTHFAGEKLDRILPESNLYKCHSCLTLLRSPILSVTEYNLLYKKADSNIWSNKIFKLRPDQEILKKIIINKKKIGKVLDIGCYTGDLLSSLPDDYLKFGIEMSKKASKVAESKGIKIIGDDLYKISTEEKFDYIIAIDVIEHTENPLNFIKSLSLVLEKNGEIIISTGNSDNWLWKNLKNKFWYSQYPEHISFIGEAWVEKFCVDFHYEISNKYKFSHPPKTIKSAIKNIVKLLFISLNIKQKDYSNITKDHFCFFLKNR